MLYRILMRVAVMLLVIPLFGLVLAIAMSPGPIQMHTDAVWLAVVFGPAALRPCSRVLTLKLSDCCLHREALP
jgi:hypothetical protein